MSCLSTEVHRAPYDVPLAISRGTTTHTELLWTTWEEAGVSGIGEGRAFSTGPATYTIADMLAALDTHRPWLEHASAVDHRAITARLEAAHAPPPLTAALDLAHHDWLARRAGWPLWQLLGAPSRPPALTSATIGLGSPDTVRARVRRWLEVGDFRAFKIKLGHPAGLSADQALFETVRSSVPAGTRLSVDANAAWSLPDAITMARWFGPHDIDYLEQPLHPDRETDFAALHAASPVPLFLDESIFTAADVSRLAPFAHGINVKLMKVGGLARAREIIATARALRLKVLVGCYGESSLGNTAAACLGAHADHFDLDSHLNLAPDPFTGLRLVAGRFELPPTAGLGATRRPTA